MSRKKTARKTFTCPSEEDCIEAIGLVRKRNTQEYTLGHTQVYKKNGITIPSETVNAFYPDPAVFHPVLAPQPGDWLDVFPEDGQTFVQFARSRYKQPNKYRNIIHILPLTFHEDGVPQDVVDSLAEFASCFFGIEVQVLNDSQMGCEVDKRKNPYDDQFQVNATQILNGLKMMVPGDSFCLAAITLDDLYPEDDWNFVFGMAKPSCRVGVYSLARYLPGFGKKKCGGSSAKLTDAETCSMLMSACGLMCHEMGHMFGLEHCIYYNCLMNGSNSMEESLSQPLHLCPVCLRKLHFSCQFDIDSRYCKMADFCDEHGLLENGEWFKKRCELLCSGESSAKTGTEGVVTSDTDS